MTHVGLVFSTAWIPRRGTLKLFENAAELENLIRWFAPILLITSRGTTVELLNEHM